MRNHDVVSSDPQEQHKKLGMAIIQVLRFVCVRGGVGGYGDKESPGFYYQSS